MRKSRDALSWFLALLIKMSAFLCVLVLVLIIGFVVVKGIPNLSRGLFSLHYTSDNCSVLPAMINTLFMIVLSLLLSGPVGLLSAVFLVEYADHTGPVVGVIRLAAETLSGIPSIVYGLFGLLFFSTACHMGWSMLSGALTLALMILPLLMRTAEEALKSVPQTYREASFGLGAGKLRTIVRVVIPSAARGILSGVILAIGRVVGETAALLYTAGTMADIAGLTQSGRTVAVHMYVLSSEGLHMPQAYATALVLVVMVFVINKVAAVLAGQMKMEI